VSAAAVKMLRELAHIRFQHALDRTASGQDVTAGLEAGLMEVAGSICAVGAELLVALEPLAHHRAEEQLRLQVLDNLAALLRAVLATGQEPQGGPNEPTPTPSTMSLAQIVAEGREALDVALEREARAERDE
jgi:hypothetical protein